MAEKTQNEILEADTDVIDLETQDIDPASYELGYHIVPTVAEEATGGVVESIRTLISERGGSIISEGQPAHVRLAYPISSVSEGKRRMFDSAYFGWIRFTCVPQQAAELKGVLAVREDILRFLLIRLTKSELAYAPKERVKVPEASSTDPEKQNPVSDEEFDKQIDELVK